VLGVTEKHTPESVTRAHALALLSAARAGYRRRAGSGSGRDPGPLAPFLALGDGLALYLRDLARDMDMDAVGREALVRCFGLDGPPENQKTVVASLASRKVGRTRVQVLLREAEEVLAKRLERELQRGSFPAADSDWRQPSPIDLRRAVQNEGYARRLRSALRTLGLDAQAREELSHQSRRVTSQLSDGLRQVERDAFGSSGLGVSVSPSRLVRLRKVAWSALLRHDPELSIVARDDAGPAVRPGRSTSRPSSADDADDEDQTVLRAIGRDGATSIEEALAGLAAGERTYTADPVLSTQAVLRIDRDMPRLLEREPRGSSTPLRSSVAVFLHSSSVHAGATPEVVDKFMRKVDDLGDRQDPGVLGTVLDHSTYSVTYKANLESSIHRLREYGARITDSPPEWHSTFQNYYELRKITTTIQCALEIADGERALKVADQRLAKLEEFDGELSSTLKHDIARNRAHVSSARAVLAWRKGRYGESDSYAQKARAVLELAEAELARDHLTVNDANRKQQRTTIGYRKPTNPLRSILSQLDIAEGLGDYDFIIQTLPAAARIWNADPTVVPFRLMLVRLHKRLAARHEVPDLILREPAMQLYGRRAPLIRDDLALITSGVRH
jgi:hypothetical protein